MKNSSQILVYVVFGFTTICLGIVLNKIYYNGYSRGPELFRDSVSDRIEIHSYDHSTQKNVLRYSDQHYIFSVVSDDLEGSKININEITQGDSLYKRASSDVIIAMRNNSWRHSWKIDTGQ